MYNKAIFSSSKSVIKFNQLKVNAIKGYMSISPFYAFLFTPLDCNNSFVIASEREFLTLSQKSYSNFSKIICRGDGTGGAIALPIFLGI